MKQFWNDRINRKEKKCAKCKELKFITDFHRHSGSVDNRTSYCKQCIKDYRIKNKKRIQKQETKYRLNRLKNNIEFRLITNLRTRLNSVIRGEVKHATTLSLIGCSLNQLKKYIEDKFSPDMSWDNYGLYGWHIDHIKPLSKFDLTDEKEIRKACNYMNLQPLWAKCNISKSNKSYY
jgi:hypothetical protein